MFIKCYDRQCKNRGTHVLFGYSEETETSGYYRFCVRVCAEHVDEYVRYWWLDKDEMKVSDDLLPEEEGTHYNSETGEISNFSWFERDLAIMAQEREKE